MADRTVASTNTLNYFRHEFNGTAEDIGTIADIVSASGYIASSTDVVEAIVAINTELPEITTDAFVFPTGTMTFEGATDDAYETVLSMTDPTADRTITFPDATGTVVLADSTDTFTNKTFTTPTITSGVLNTAVSGTAVKDEDNMASDSATVVATQQSIKAYVDNEIDTEMDLVFATDSGSGQITMDSEVLTLAGGTGIDSVGGSNTITYNIDSTVSTLVGSQTFTNKTLTSPTLTTPVFNTALSGTAFLDEDNLGSNSATKLASQQSVKAYIDAQTTAQDLDIAPDSGSAQAIDLDSETLTFSGGTAIATSASSNTVTMAIDSTITTLTGSQTLTNKTLTSPTISAMTFASGTSTSGMQIGGTGVVFEGATADAYETTLTVKEPTQDNTITIPNTSITLLTTATHANKANHIVRCIALG
ncbi:MAG: hypothetical protein H8D84_02235 [Proteobacteria bacterium]|nr:hypothetical protein [Pseudomonadota bacterium]